MLRILHVIRSLDSAAGGPVEALRNQAACRASMGIATSAACLDAPQRIPEIPGATTLSLGHGPGVYGYSSVAVQRLRGLTTTHDIAVINGLWQFHALAAHRAFAGRLPYVVFPHGMLDPWFNRTYPLKALKKRLYWRFGDYRVLRDSAAVCFTSEAERRLARESFRPYVAREAVVSYGTTSPPAASDSFRQAFLARCPGAANRRYLLFLGRIQEKKGCDLLIDSFASVAAQWPDLMLVMAGPDQDGLTARLQRRAAAADLTHRILWPGMLRDDAKWGAFYGADAFCLPSHQENFGVAVAESLACGIPVLISDQVNIWREIEAGGAGFVAPDTVHGMTGLLHRWMGLTPEAVATMRAAARACFLERFEIRQAVCSLTGLLQRILAGDLPEPWSASE
jgi:glycosyltransferase involved in cell wall biosynthesis